jgi:hypothetical protein
MIETTRGFRRRLLLCICSALLLPAMPGYGEYKTQETILKHLK